MVQEWDSIPIAEKVLKSPNAKLAVHEQSRYIIYVHNLLLDQQSRPPQIRALQKLLPRKTQLLRAPSLEARSSSILATRFLNSSYWHFSYECRSSCRKRTKEYRLTKRILDRGGRVDRFEIGGPLGRSPYLALPWKVIFCLSAAVEGNEKVGTRIAILHGEASLRHLLAGR